MATIDAREASPADADLYWSRRGQVACGLHAPVVGSERWIVEQWTYIPVGARSRHGIDYQCPRCAGTRSPLVHRRGTRATTA